MPAWRRILLVFTVLAITALALALRVRAVNLLPVDYDEDDYLRAAQQYQVAIHRGDWDALTQLNYRPEHPQLSKLAYALAILHLPEVAEIADQPTSASPSNDLPKAYLDAGRAVSAAAGTLEVFILALLNPLAGLLLAVHTWQIKYTSQVMLEAIPSFTSLLMVATYLRSKMRWNGWLAASAAAFGLTVAGKYPYGLVGLVVVGHWLHASWPEDEQRTGQRLVRWLRPVAAYLVVALVVFFVFDPYLWPNPIGRLASSLLYHGGYATSSEVSSTGFPAWQQLNWLFSTVPWHPGVFLVLIDLPVALLAVVGFPRLWRRQRVIALWLLVELGFLLVWPTKWPQYLLMLTAPLAYAAAEGFMEFIGEPLRNGLKRLLLRFQTGGSGRKPRAGLKATLRAVPWLIIGTVTLLAITIFPLVYQGGMALTDFNIFSIKDGLQGGVLREAWLGLTGQVDAVQVTIDNNGRLLSTNVVKDRGEIQRLVTTQTQGKFSAKDVHYAGPGMFLNLLFGIGGQVLVFELIWTLLTVGLQTLLGLAVAMALNRRGVKFAGWWRTLFILPWALPEFVGALAWMAAFEPTNGWLALGLKKANYWQATPESTLLVLVAAALWMGWPFMMLAATAGLKMLPAEVYDAAAIAGASGWNQFRWVTWPLLLPLLGPAIIIRSIFAFNQFYLFYVMRTPFELSTFASISYSLFNTNNGAGLFSVSAVINIITVVFLLGLVLLLNRWNRTAEEVSYA